MRKLDGLTALRFFAALAIAILHSKAAFKTTSWIQAPVPLEYGVSFFFVLSGFILTYAYREIGSVRSVRNFYVARIARVWPLHLAGLLICIALLPENIWFVRDSASHKFSVTTTNIFLVQGWIPVVGYFYAFNAVAWSLSTELFFYLAFPFLRKRWDSTWKLKAVLVFTVVAIALCLPSMLHVGALDLDKANSMSVTGFAYISPVTRIGEFFIGMIAGSFFIRYENVKAKPLIVWSLLEVGSFAMIPLCAAATIFLPRWFESNLSATAWEEYAKYSGAAPAFACIVFVFAFQGGLLSKFLSLKPMVLLGEASFALYVGHQLLISLFYIHLPFFSRFPDMVNLVGYWCSTLALAFALLVGVERPCRKIIKSMFERRAA